MFFCYRVTNLVNRKVYIGKTNRARIRWKEHVSRALSPQSGKYNYPLSHAIRKYGSGNFIFEIIAFSEIEANINECEKLFIKLYKSNISVFGKSYGYNLTEGGEGVSGFTFTEKTRLKMSNSHKGLRPSQESLDKRSKSRTGTLHTDEVKNKLSIMFSGENSSTAKLNLVTVRLIREDYNSNNFTQKELSIKYGVSPSNIGAIVRNESWRI